MTPPIQMDRRAFLKTTAVAGATVVLGRWSFPALGVADTAKMIPPAPSWVDKPMRWAQLTLVEDDPGKFDRRFWLDYPELTVPSILDHEFVAVDL